MIRSDLFPLEDRLQKGRMPIGTCCLGGRKTRDSVNPRDGDHDHADEAGVGGGWEAFNSCL